VSAGWGKINRSSERFCAFYVPWFTSVGFISSVLAKQGTTPSHSRSISCRVESLKPEFIQWTCTSAELSQNFIQHHVANWSYLLLIIDKNLFVSKKVSPGCIDNSMVRRFRPAEAYKLCATNIYNKLRVKFSTGLFAYVGDCTTTCRLSYYCHTIIYDFAVKYVEKTHPAITCRCSVDVQTTDGRLRRRH